MQKATCKKCGRSDGLYWNQSAKGNWYLAETRNVGTSYGGNLRLPLAHSRMCFPAELADRDCEICGLELDPRKSDTMHARCRAKQEGK
jgi:hypothetical protein